MFSVSDLSVHYGKNLALKDVSMDVRPRRITAIIGPSGCGKSTLIRCFNRMNELIPGAQVSGEVLYHGENIYVLGCGSGGGAAAHRHGVPASQSLPQVDLRQHRLRGQDQRLQGRHGRTGGASACAAPPCGTRSRIKLKKSALDLSGGQQQRLCIARAIAVEPDVILMDEPASALDPIATVRIEDLMQELKQEYSIIIVTHNMQQAARVSDETAFLYTEVDEETSARWGILVEFGTHESDIHQATGQADGRLRLGTLRISGERRTRRRHARRVP